MAAQQSPQELLALACNCLKAGVLEQARAWLLKITQLHPQLAEAAEAQKPLDELERRAAR